MGDSKSAVAAMGFAIEGFIKMVKRLQMSKILEQSACSRCLMMLMKQS